jgi:hypothetical protein
MVISLFKTIRKFNSDAGSFRSALVNFEGRMAKKNTIKLDMSEEMDFSLTGIACGHKDYKLCFDINLALNLNMIRVEDVVLPLTRPGSFTHHSCYSTTGIDGEVYYLVSNRDKSGSGFFVPEMRNINYFFVVAGEGGKYIRDRILGAFRGLKIVEAAYDMDPSKMKSAEAFLYLLEFKTR